MKKGYQGLLSALLFVAAAGSAHAGAVLVNGAGTVAIGMNDDGSLNTSTGNVVVNAGATGVAYKFPDGSFRDATAPGCLCEGWGVSVNGTTSGFANVSTDGGPNNLSFGAISTGAGTMTATTTLTSLPGISVSHTVTEASSSLFKVHVVITNSTGAGVTDLKYVRVMDWDVPPTEFNEFVTIAGTTTTTLLEKSHLNGFATANPLSTGCDASGCGYGGVDMDVTKAGAADHGAYFRFNFGSLADGASYAFDIFYGAAANEAGALAAVGAEGLELFSLGYSNGGGFANTASPTFIFGFEGVGGTPVIPGVPAPASVLLLGIGLLGLVSLRRKA